LLVSIIILPRKQMEKFHLRFFDSLRNVGNKRRRRAGTGGARHGERHSNKQSKETCGQLIEALSRHKMISPSTRLLVLCSLAYHRKFCRAVGEGGREKKTQPAGIACRREGSTSWISKRPGGCCNVLGCVIGLFIHRVFVGCNNVLVLLSFSCLACLVACCTLSVFVRPPQM